MSTFNMRPYYSELLTLYFSGKMRSKPQSELGAYLRKDAMIREVGIPRAGERSGIQFGNLTKFKDLLAILQREGLPINRDFIMKMLFDI